MKLTAVVQTEFTASHLAAWFITRSQWFAVTPLPDDEWRFEYKADFADHVKQFLQAVGAK